MDSISGFTNLSCDHHIVVYYLRGIIPEVQLGRGFADRNSVCSGKVGEMTRMQAETQAFQKNNEKSRTHDYFAVANPSGTWRVDTHTRLRNK